MPAKYSFFFFLTDLPSSDGIIFREVEIDICP